MSICIRYAPASETRIFVMPVTAARAAESDAKLDDDDAELVQGEDRDD